MKPSAALFLSVLTFFAVANPATDRAQAQSYADPRFIPLPETVEVNPTKARLGSRLFHDPRLSLDGTVSCATCHDLRRGGVDGLFRSVGVGGGVGAVNSPTVYNTGFNLMWFWDGRARSLEDQIEGPIHHPKEMASNWDLIIARLSADERYRDTFAFLYPNGIQRENIKDAIATFERQLVTPSRFDDYLRGNPNALSAREHEGFRRFRELGCVMCHSGINIGGDRYRKMGVFRDYFADRGGITQADMGLYNLTGNPAHKHFFRVASLRNVALTAPYFHDGNAATLHQAVRVMMAYQLPQNPNRPHTEEDVQLIVEFLRSLTGRYRGRPLDSF